MFIPQSVTYIGAAAFGDCATFRTIVFQEGSRLRRLGRYCFENTALREIEIPSSVMELGEYAFSGTALREVSFQKGSMLTEIDASCFEGTEIEEIRIPSGVVRVGYHAFANCRNLRRAIFEEDNGLDASDVCKRNENQQSEAHAH